MRVAFAAATGDYWRAYRTALGDVPWTRDLEPRTVRHTLGCLLARVAGRSTLEYMDGDARARQRAAALALMQQPPISVTDLAERFVALLAV
jgi:hypothetical protein